MKKVKSWIALTVALYLVFLLWTLPAHYVVSFLEKRNVSPAKDFSMSGVEGAWTAGRILVIKTGGVELNNLSWRFQPFGLIFGRLQFALASDFAGGSVAGVLRAGLGNVELAQLQGGVPVVELGQIYLPGFELAGVVEIEDLALIVKDGYLSGGSGQLTWRNAKVNSPYQMSLGGVKLDLSTENDGISFKVNDLGEALQTSGLGFLSSEGKYSFDGTIGARQGSSPELATFLQILGRPGADGMVKLGFKGQMARFF
ncbi:MAG: type II secretion system protein N [Thermodesulfobacteriota bacterium]